jgi:FKBP-type peptidyl-prolyl cis-trans isomerase 2
MRNGGILPGREYTATDATRGKVIDPTPQGIRQQAQNELREEIGFRAGKLEKLLDFYSHPGYIVHKVHLLVAYDLEWDLLEMEDGEEIRVHTCTLDEAFGSHEGRLSI